MAPAYLKTPVPIRSSCLSNHTAVVVPSAPDYTPAWDTKIHVAFFDTRRSPRLYDIQMAAAVFNTSSVLLSQGDTRPYWRPCSYSVGRWLGDMYRCTRFERSPFSLQLHQPSPVSWGRR